MVGITSTMLWRRLLWHRNQSVDLQSKSTDSFLYDRGLRPDRAKFLLFASDWKKNYHVLNLRFHLVVLFSAVPADTGRKLNVLCTFNLRPVSTGVIDQFWLIRVSLGRPCHFRVRPRHALKVSIYIYIARKLVKVQH